MYALKKIDSDMKACMVCEWTGWTYEEYLAQPAFLVDLLFERKRIDAHRKAESEDNL